MNTQLDVRDVLPTIQAPTLVLHRRGDLDPSVEEALDRGPDPRRQVRRAARRRAHALGRRQDSIVDEIEEFLTGARRGPEPDRVLATVLFTDIVGSTERAERSATAVGGSSSSGTTTRQAAARALPRPELDTAGDGFFATFDGPARAIVPRGPSPAGFASSASRSAPGSTPASASGTTARSPALPCRPARVSLVRRAPAKCSSRRPSRTWSQARGSRSRTG